MGPVGVPVALGSVGPQAGDTKRDLFSRLPNRSRCGEAPPACSRDPGTWVLLLDPTPCQPLLRV